MSPDLFSPLPEPGVDVFGNENKSKTLGVVALVVALVFVAGAVVVAVVAGHPLGAEAGRAFAEAPVGQGVDPTWPTALQGWMLTAEIGFVAGTVGGMWALAQAAVAMISLRGPAAGAVAAVIAAAGPLLFMAALAMAAFAGYTATASMPVG